MLPAEQERRQAPYPDPAAAQVESAQPPSPKLPTTYDPLALEIFRELKHRCERDRWAVLYAVRGSALGGVADARVALCLQALGACYASEAKLSKGVYAEWRAGQTRPDEWPSTKYIADTFGSWSRACAAAGRSVVLDVLVRAVDNHDKSYTRAEILAALEEYGDTEGRLLFTPYLLWARERMRDPARRLPRYIRNVQRINKLFGSFDAALDEAGLGERRAAERGERHRRIGMPSDYTRARCRHWLRALAPKCGGRAMTIAGYTAQVHREELRAQRRGERLVIPSASVIAQRFGSWPDALEAAGVATAEELRELRRGNTRFRSDAEVLESLATAVRKLGPRLTIPEYTQFREKRRRPDGSVSLVSEALIRQRFGRWGEALAEVAELEASQQPPHARARIRTRRKAAR
jgi:hypothetical protein